MPDSNFEKPLPYAREPARATWRRNIVWTVLGLGLIIACIAAYRSFAGPFERWLTTRTIQRTLLAIDADISGQLRTPNDANSLKRINGELKSLVPSLQRLLGRMAPVVNQPNAIQAGRLADSNGRAWDNRSSDQSSRIPNAHGKFTAIARTDELEP